MITKSVPGQTTLFNIEDYANGVNSNFSSEITPISTRTKACIKRHKPISRETIERTAVKLTSLPSLK